MYSLAVLMFGGNQIRILASSFQFLRVEVGIKSKLLHGLIIATTLRLNATAAAATAPDANRNTADGRAVPSDHLWSRADTVVDFLDVLVELFFIFERVKLRTQGPGDLTGTREDSHEILGPSGVLDNDVNVDSLGQGFQHLAHDSFVNAWGLCPKVELGFVVQRDVW